MKVQIVKDVYRTKKERKPLAGKGKRTVERKKGSAFEQFLFEFVSDEKTDKK